MDEMKPGEVVGAGTLGLAILGIIWKGLASVISFVRQVKENTEAIEQIKKDSKEQFALVRSDIKDVSDKAEKRDGEIFKKLDTITNWIVEGKGE